MKAFLKVTNLKKVLECASDFPRVATEEISLTDTVGRVIAADIIADSNLPGFARSTMDGYAVRASSTYGASEGNPAYLTVKGSVAMGQAPAFAIGQESAAIISTGGMLPDGADSVVMLEHTGIIDDTTIEVYKSIAPGHNVVRAGEDIKKDDPILFSGQKIRPQEAGLLAAFGKETVRVYKKPVIGIISSGDEIVSIDQTPAQGFIRDINTYTLSGLVKNAGGVPISFGIVKDSFDDLFEKCSLAFAETDMVLISGGSSVGVRDFTLEALSLMPDADILVHGISISPGKPTILATIKNKILWGLPGHVVSAMIVFTTVVRPFIEHLGGLGVQPKIKTEPQALLSRNISSALGRTDYIRVRLIEKDGILWAEPILGKSGLISTLVKADGLIKIGINTEGLKKGAKVSVISI